MHFLFRLFLTVMQLKQNTRTGRSSSEDGDDELFSASRHAARSPPYSPPYSPPFSPRLGRQASMARPQVPRLGREASTYKRAVAAALLPRQQQQDRQQGTAPAATEPAAARNPPVWTGFHRGHWTLKTKKTKISNLCYYVA